MRLVTIAQFHHQDEAYIAQSALLSEGIDATLADQHIVGIDPLATVAYRGVKLLVPEESAGQARALLSAADQQTRTASTRPRWPIVADFVATLLAVIALFLIVGDPRAAGGWLIFLSAALGWVLGRKRLSSKG